MRKYSALIAAFATGGIISIMVVANTNLGALTSNEVSMSVNQAIGVVLTTVMLAAGRKSALICPPRQKSRWYMYFGGLFGVLIMIANFYSVLNIGAALAMAAAVFGQSMTGLILDLGGFFHMKKRSFSTRKALSALVSFSGIFVMTFARGGSASLLYVLMGIGAGVLTMLQMCYNSSFAKKKGAIFSARQNALSGLLGTLAYAFVLLPDETAKGFMALSGVSLPAACLGGILAVAVVVSSNLIIPLVPALWSSLLMSAGQIITSVVIDAVFYGSFSPWLLCGALLLLAGMLLSFFSERSDESGEL